MNEKWNLRNFAKFWANIEYEEAMREKARLMYEFDWWEEEEEEPEVCPDGYTEDEWCDPETRGGIESCEFCCPFGRMDGDC